jgi:hypothetical protein
MHRGSASLARPREKLLIENSFTWCRSAWASAGFIIWRLRDEPSRHEHPLRVYLCPQAEMPYGSSSDRGAPILYTSREDARRRGAGGEYVAPRGGPETRRRRRGEGRGARSQESGGMNEPTPSTSRLRFGASRSARSSPNPTRFAISASATTRTSRPDGTRSASRAGAVVSCRDPHRRLDRRPRDPHR